VCSYIVIGFWHAYWIAGAVLLATALVAVLVHSAGYVHVELDNDPQPDTSAAS
jgi:hypothetical protein